MVQHVEKLLQSLDLPYRILRLCGGDMGFTSAMTYDFEVYSAAQEKWLEVSSVSNFESFQTNRMKIRFKDAGGKTQLVHSLNGSSLALPRVLAWLENHQQTDILRCRMRSGDILVRRGSTRIERATDNRHPTPTEWRITIEDNE